MNVRVLSVTTTILIIGTGAANFLEESVAGATRPEPRNSMQLAEFEIVKARIGQFGRNLSEVSTQSICVEEGRLFAVKGEADPKVVELATKREAGLTLRVHDGTVKDVLRALTDADPSYTWTRDPATEITNVYPKENAPLGWKTSALKFSEKTVREVLQTGDLLGLGQKNIIFDAGRGNLAWLDTRISLDSGPVKAREAVNRICSQLGFRARWEVFEMSPVKGKVIHILMFHGINPPAPTK